MSHTVIVIDDSFIDAFDPNDPKYAGVRDHFSAETLARIDAIRARPVPRTYSFEDKLLLSYAVGKVIMTAENP